MKNQKSNLDERQEQTLLKIERNGCWLAFWGLVISVMVQLIIDNSDFRAIAGELLLLMAMSLYIVVACIKNGIWDRRLKPNFLTNLIVSLIAAVFFGIITFLSIYIKFPDKISGSIAGGVFSAVSVFVLCFGALLIFAGIFNKRQKKLEQEPDDTEAINR